MTQTEIDFVLRSLARDLADRGMSRVAVRNAAWIEKALEQLGAFARARSQFRMEEFRAVCSLLPPTSSNAWGALTNIAVSRGLIRWTGRYESSTSPATHGHPVKVWEAA